TEQTTITDTKQIEAIHLTLILILLFKFSFVIFYIPRDPKKVTITKCENNLRHSKFNIYLNLNHNSNSQDFAHLKVLNIMGNS
ncbi:hypothetical protein CMK16_10295, partial [Candidatus Poribacteria bacterium]|nr:hypothetical protein [Candidatus Poribacteria bacterium]